MKSSLRNWSKPNRVPTLAALIPIALGLIGCSYNYRSLQERNATHSLKAVVIEASPLAWLKINAGTSAQNRFPDFEINSSILSASLHTQVGDKIYVAASKQSDGGFSLQHPSEPQDQRLIANWVDLTTVDSNTPATGWRKPKTPELDNGLSLETSHNYWLHVQVVRDQTIILSQFAVSSFAVDQRVLRASGSPKNRFHAEPPNPTKLLNLRDRSALTVYGFCQVQHTPGNTAAENLPIHASLTFGGLTVGRASLGPEGGEAAISFDTTRLPSTGAYPLEWHCFNAAKAADAESHVTLAAGHDFLPPYISSVATVQMETLAQWKLITGACSRTPHVAQNTVSLSFIGPAPNALQLAPGSSGAFANTKIDVICLAPVGDPSAPAGTWGAHVKQAPGVTLMGCSRIPDFGPNPLPVGDVIGKPGAASQATGITPPLNQKGLYRVVATQQDLAENESAASTEVTALESHPECE